VKNKFSKKLEEKRIKKIKRKGKRYGKGT